MTSLAADDSGQTWLAPARRVIQFGRLLRDNGYQLDLRAVGDAVALLDTTDVKSPTAMRASLRAQFCRSKPELERFDDLFDAYWLGRVGKRRRVNRALPSAAAQSVVEHNRGGSAGGGGGLARYFDWAAGKPGAEDEHELESGGDLSLSGASAIRTGNRSRRDLGQVRDPDEAERLLALAERLGRRLRYRLSRRRHAAAYGSEIDLRATIRHSLGTGGLPFLLRRRRRTRPPVSLLVFIDVSGSMDAYSLFFIRFLHALARGFDRMAAFLFHSDLVPITEVLLERNPVAMMDRLVLLGRGWSGGTRMGEALAAFNRDHRPRWAGARTIVLTMTDGFDAGSPALLESELRKLKGHCRRLIWLNPLLGRSDYAPLARGARHLERHADLALPAHNLASLLAIEDALAHV